jgi:ankyrin repeat protein
MKKLLLLSGIVALHTFVGIQAMEPARPQKWKKMDTVIPKNPLRSKNWSGVFQLLDAMKGSIDVNEYRTVNGETLLNRAVRHEQLAAAKQLLEKYGANPNIQNENSDSALFLACVPGNIPMIQLLLQHGANPYLKSELMNRMIDVFDYVSRYRMNNNNPTILKLLNEYKK